MAALAFSPALRPAPTQTIGDPRTEIRAGAALIGVFAIGFLGWSAVSRLDAAVHSPGVVRISGDRQVVQSPTGGIVSAIRAHEGEVVREGQVLLELSTTEVLAKERSLASQAIGLLAETARIRADRAGLSRVPLPADLALFGDAHKAEADEAMRMADAELGSQRALSASERAVMQQRIAQVSHQIEGYRQRQTSTQRQRSINEEELATYQSLFDKGFGTKSRVLALKRSAAAIDGDMGTNVAEMARLNTAAGESRLQILQMESERQQRNADRLRAAEVELQAVMPQWRAAREQLDRTSLRAPVSGTVTGLAVHTVGGVVPAGATLMEVVPNQRALVVEAQVSLADANDLRPQQHATVRLAGLQGRTSPVLDGVISRISADSFTEEKTGRAYYVAEVRVAPGAFAKAGHDAQVAGPIRAGTPVEVLVPLKPRTALGYWLGPLSQRFSGALTER